MNVPLIQLEILIFNVSHPGVFIYTYTVQCICQTHSFSSIKYYFKATCFDSF